MRTVISKDGTPIAFDQSGQGPTLILVAGATATRLAEASLAAALAPHFTVFAYDRHRTPLAHGEGTHASRQCAREGPNT